MPDISIFAKRAFVNTNHGIDFDPANNPRRGHLLRVSSMIRADQIAERLGARLNPPTCYHNDVCIYVKPHVKNGYDFQFEGRPYLDIVDGWGLLPVARRHPGVGVIACSQADGETLRSVLPNRVTVIPQHHCNFERAVRAREGVTRVGVIGTRGAFDYLPAGLVPALAERGIELETYSKFFTRADVCAFYQRIDVQIVWRPWRMRLANPLKLVNAASFGVPTIAFRETVFEEARGCYAAVGDLAGLLSKLNELLFIPDLHANMVKGCAKVAERYHIDHIADMYRSLN